jgi:hypothetical protein
MSRLVSDGVGGARRVHGDFVTAEKLQDKCCVVQIVGSTLHSTSQTSNLT